MKRLIVSLVLTVSLLIGSILPVAAFTPTDVNISAEAALLADLGRDTVVFEKNADAKMYPASLTKIMTAVVVMDECADPASVSVEATFDALDPLYGTDSSIFGLEMGEVMNAYDLLALMMIQSANDAANVLAYHFGGEDIDAFIAKMNQKATDLGLTNTHYVNAHGLHDSDHYTTARDLYTLTKYALEKPMFRDIVTSLYYEAPETNVHWEQVVETTVFLQDPDEEEYYYEYAKGVKTGYTDPAGRCLVSTAEKDGTTYLCVLLKCPVEDADGNYVREEFGVSKGLYEWAFNTLEYRAVNDTASTVGHQNVLYGKDTEQVAVHLNGTLESIVEKAYTTDQAQVQVTFDAEAVEAPIVKGQKLGTATVSAYGKEIGTVEVVAATDVQKDGWKVFAAGVKSFFSLTIVKVVLWILGILVLLFILFVLYCFWCRARNRRRRKRRAEERRRRAEQANRNPFDVENK